MCILHLNRGRSHFNLAPWYCLVRPSSWVTSIKLLPSVYKHRKIGTITLRGQTKKNQHSPQQQPCYSVAAWGNSRHLTMTPTISPRNDVSVRNERGNTIQFSADQKHYRDLGSNASSVCAHFSGADVTTRGNQWWLREMWAIFLGTSLKAFTFWGK